jgi:cytochrome c biogenesis protein
MALILILLIAAVVFVGTVLDQAPPSVAADPQAYQEWLNRAGTKYGGWTVVFDRLGLFDVFHSLFFRGLIVLLAVSIVVCTVSRWRGIWNTVFHTRVRMDEPFFESARHSARFASGLGPAEAGARVGRALSRAHYRVRADAAPGSVALFGDRNRLARFGTLFTHLSIVLILAGAAAGGVWGFKDPGFVVAEGETRDLGLDTGLAVRLDHFSDEYYADGAPKDFFSDLVLFENGKQVKAATVRVNSPLRYNGIAFHQAFYGQSAVMKVQDDSGTVVFDQAVPLAGQSRQGARPLGRFPVPGQNLTAYVIGPASGHEDPLIAPGQMRLEIYRQDALAAAPATLSQGSPQKLAGMTFTFERESRFTVLDVVKDPGANVIWIACALLLVGLVMFFYFPRRRAWALCKAAPGGGSEVALAMPSQRDARLDREFDRLRDQVGQALQDAQEAEKGGRRA